MLKVQGSDQSAQRSDIEMELGLLWVQLIVTYASVASGYARGSGACDVRMRTESGWLCGRVRMAELGIPYASFRGVPYAKPPIGARRFQELEPPDPWFGFLDATEDSPVCPQKDILYGEMTQHLNGMSEDCIYLNLHVPLQALPSSEEDLIAYNLDQYRGLPILVMIHGGGFHTGSGLTDMHGPEYLITKDVIVITFNYRLNIFGFLSLGTAKIPGNQALRDQLTLLRWVQRHARAFGGDPDNVTIMGQSAGATATHLLSKAAQGLFHKVILMSGTALPNFYDPTPKFAKQLADNFFNYLGINSTDANEIHRQLVEMPLVNIMLAHNQLLYDYGLTALVPVVEDEHPGVTRVIDEHPLELMAQGRGKDYPLLIGFTDKEEEFFRWLCIFLNIMRRVQENPKILLTSHLGDGRISEIMQLDLAKMISDRYFNGTPTLDKYLVLLGDTFFRHPAISGALWTAMAGAPTYLFQFSYKAKRSLIKDGLWVPYEGAAHVEDLTNIFKVNSMLADESAFPPKNRDDLTKDWMTTLFTNFMKCGTPTCCEDQCPWPPLSPDQLRYQNIEEPMMFDMKDATPEQMDMVNFFNSLDEDYRNITERLKKWNQNTG